MLRSEITASVSNLLDALEESGVPVVLEDYSQQAREKADAPRMLTSFTRFMQLAQSFGPAEHQLINIMDLKNIMDSSFWAALITSDEGRNLGVQMHFRLNFALTHLPKLLSLLGRKTDTIGLMRTKDDLKESNLLKLSVLVMEEQDLSSPQRLVLTLEAVQGLYEVAGAVIDMPTTDLAVLACDSGSDKSFDFLGAAKIVQCVKDIILSFWDKVVYFREDKTGKQLELIAQSLPILDEIEKLRNAGKLEPEKAELLKRQTISSITKFAKAGLTIPEIEGRTTYNPRQLMRAEQKLLVGSTKPVPTDSSGEQPQQNTDFSDPALLKYLEPMAKEFLKRRGEGPNASTSEGGGDEETAQPEDPDEKQ